MRWGGVTADLLALLCNSWQESMAEFVVCYFGCHLLPSCVQMSQSRAQDERDERRRVE